MKRLNIVSYNNHKIISVHSGICMCKCFSILVKIEKKKDGRGLVEVYLSFQMYFLADRHSSCVFS